MRAYSKSYLLRRRWAIRKRGAAPPPPRRIRLRDGPGPASAMVALLERARELGEEVAHWNTSRGSP